MHARIPHAARTPWRVATCVLALASAPVAASAQLTPDVDLHPGTPLMIYRRDEPLREAVFESAGPTVLRVRDRCAACAGATAIPWTDLARVDALVAGRPSVGRIVVGGLAGATGTIVLLIGAALATSAVVPCHWDTPYGSCPALGLVVAAPVLIGVGTGVGMIVAHRRRPKRWVRVWTS
jgi:hypothetical protein